MASGFFIINTALIMKVLGFWIETRKPNKTLLFKSKVSVSFNKPDREYSV